MHRSCLIGGENSISLHGVFGIPKQGLQQLPIILHTIVSFHIPRTSESDGGKTSMIFFDFLGLPEASWATALQVAPDDHMTNTESWGKYFGTAKIVERWRSTYTGNHGQDITEIVICGITFPLIKGLFPHRGSQRRWHLGRPQTRSSTTSGHCSSIVW